MMEEREERENFFDALREEIASKMKHLDNAKKRFITEEDQKAIWSTHVKKIIHYIGLQDDIQERIEQHFLKTVMILVKIGWKKWDTFGRIFLETENRTDEENFRCKFPELASESFLNSREKAQCFVDNRAYFRPWVIKKSGIEDLDDLVWRLPFLEGEEELGKGASGKVTKELIAAKHFLIDGDSENKIPKNVACKSFSSSDDFEQEVDILHVLESASTQHQRIVPFLAVIRIGHVFNIISELASMHLGDFLHGNTCNMDFESMIKESWWLADALHYLHNNLTLPNRRGKIACCHLDLKPENILVYREAGEDSNHPVGKWKISDFGISFIARKKPQPADDKTKPKEASRLAFTEQELATERFEPRRPTGTWQPPEVNSLRLKISGRKSDIWSYGCILFQIVTRSLTGADGLDEVDIHRRTEGDDTFYRGEQLNPAVDKFLREMVGRIRILRPNIPQISVENCRDLIRGLLEIEPDKRLSTEVIKDVLAHTRGNHAFKLGLSNNAEVNPRTPVICQEFSPFKFEQEEANIAIVQKSSPPRHFQRESQSPHQITETRWYPTPSPRPIKHQDFGLYPQVEAQSLHKMDSPETRAYSQVEDHGRGQEGLVNSPQPSIYETMNSDEKSSFLLRDFPTLNLTHAGDSEYRGRPRSSSFVSVPNELSPPPHSDPRCASMGRFSARNASLATSGVSADLKGNKEVDSLSPTRIVPKVSGSGYSSKSVSNILTFDIRVCHDVKHAVLSACCRKVAFVAEDKIILFRIENHLSRTEVKPPPKVVDRIIWKSASLSNYFLLARGQWEDDQRTVFFLYALKDEEDFIKCDLRKEWLFEDKTVPYRNGVISPRDDTILFQEKGLISVQTSQTNGLDSTAQSKSIKYQIEVTGAAQKCWFNQSGDWAFAYSFGGQDHHVYAWPVSDSSKIQQYEYDVPDHRVAKEVVKDVFPFPELQRCVIWQHDNNLSIITRDKMGKCIDSPILCKSKVAAIIENDEELLVVQQSDQPGWFSRRTSNIGCRISRYGLKIGTDADEIFENPVNNNSVEIDFLDDMSTVMFDYYKKRVFIGHHNGTIETIIL